MTDNVEPPFDRDMLEEMNAKAIQNECFTPDKVYIDLGLMKDIPLGIVYAHALQTKTADEFHALQASIMPVIKDYQTRRYDTVDPYLGPIGYTDDVLQELLSETLPHDLVFMAAPVTKFFNVLISHTIRNQNHSGPANKFERKKIDARHYSLEPIPITYYFNTFPLTLSNKLLTDLAKELGESFGVNIKFMNKDPISFDEEDWETWMEAIDCFYWDGTRYNRGEMVLRRQGNMDFAGVYFFLRKRFEKCVMEEMKKNDFVQQIQVITSQIDMMCDFNWLQNNDVRLTDEAEDSGHDEHVIPDDGTTS